MGRHFGDFITEAGQVFMLLEIGELVKPGR